jgi:hypothetical protein
LVLACILSTCVLAPASVHASDESTGSWKIIAYPLLAVAIVGVPVLLIVLATSSKSNKSEGAKERKGANAVGGQDKNREQSPATTSSAQLMVDPSSSGLAHRRVRRRRWSVAGLTRVRSLHQLETLLAPLAGEDRQAGTRRALTVLSDPIGRFTLAQRG